MPWLEPIALFGAMSRAERLSDAARARMRPWAEAARVRYGVARELRDPETQTVALALLREAAFFALCALAAAAENAAELPRSSQAAWTSFVVPEASPPNEASELELVRAAFASDDPLALDAVPESEVNRLRLAAEAIVAWLLALAEVRPPKRLARLRLVRGITSGVVVIVALAGLIAYALALASVAPR